MTNREERVLAWLVPGLLSATLAVVGWAGMNIQRMSESLAVVVYRVESQQAEIRGLDARLYVLELRPQQRQMRR